ncbi:protein DETOXIFICATION 27 isoform X1 [Vigna angularis]|uniref:protein DETOXIFICATION 27 isoform X1 n=1 Tax=Phaseolus angularis TaxID=3914 RepID=UPI0022B3ACC6|nr:protein DETOXIFICATION 27 isoform X1 [Vigna angularis]
MESFKGDDETEKNLAVALLQPEQAVIHAEQRHGQSYEEQSFGNKLWVETKKLWVIVGPSIFSRLASFNMNVITQAFAGHLGEVELAAISIANTVIVGFNFGLLLGMASALETLCGQAYGAKRYHMLGIYMQRSWIVLFLCCFLLLPFYIFATPLLKFLGQPDDVAEWSGVVAVWLIPLHFSFAFQFPLQRFLQCQLKTAVIAWVSLAGLVVNAVTSWLLVYVWDFGLYGAAISLDISWWVLVFGMYAYAAYGGCPLTWKGFSVEAFSGLWEFLKLSSASGVMLCLENWYYRILVLMTGQLENATIAVDALSICMTINGWEMMIPLAFFAGTGYHQIPRNLKETRVRVANELGAGNGKGAKFATLVSVTESIVIGVVFCVLIMMFHDYLAYIFTTSSSVLQAVDDMSFLLAITILLNSVQPILSGVAVGSGWQAYVAYINIGSYYLIGLPLGIIMGWVFKTGVAGIWTGMIFGGTALQTLILIIVTIRCDWEKEAEKARFSVNKWSRSNSNGALQIPN